MSKMSMTQIEVISALLNNCHVLWLRKSTPGSPMFKVVSAYGERIGRVNPYTIELLWKFGFLKAEGDPVKAVDGTFQTRLVLGKPRMPFFSLSEEVSGNE